MRARKGKLTPEQRVARAERARLLSADPAIVAKRTAAMLATAADPAVRVRHAEACREAKIERMRDPAFRAKLVEAGKSIGAQNLLRGRTPEAREKGRQSLRRKHLAWCPEEFWGLNEQLKRKGYLLEERKAIILADVEGTPEHARRTVENHQFATELRHARDLAQRY